MKLICDLGTSPRDNDPAAAQPVPPQVQPATVKVHKLNRFFGQRPPIEKEEGDQDTSSDEDASTDEKIDSENYSKFKAKKMLGESLVDVEREARAANFQHQPPHVLIKRLEKKFGECVPAGQSGIFSGQR
jgi:hypothetical protein